MLTSKTAVLGVPVDFIMNTHLFGLLGLVFLFGFDRSPPTQVVSGRTCIAHSQVLADFIGEVCACVVGVAQINDGARFIIIIVLLSLSAAMATGRKQDGMKLSKEETYVAESQPKSQSQSEAQDGDYGQCDGEDAATGPWPMTLAFWRVGPGGARGVLSRSQTQRHIVVGVGVMIGNVLPEAEEV